MTEIETEVDMIPDFIVIAVTAE